MKLALGTVQFGLDYGVSNRTGQVAPSEVSAILAAARAAGIKTVDTAIAYGNSEARLGAAGVKGFDVVSKLPAGVPPSSIRDHVTASLERLGITELYGLLLHRSSDLAGPDCDSIHGVLASLRQDGLVRKIGVSIYDPVELEPLLERFALDLIQAPYNIVDRRLVTSGWLARLKQANVEVHTRSAFLQGLLLMQSDERPAAFAQWRQLFRQWDDWLATTGQTAVAAALGFITGNPDIDRVVVGVDSSEQLRQIIAALQAAPLSVAIDVSSDDAGLINPSNWKTS